MNFFRNVISHLLKNAFDGHTQFSVADDTAVGANPVRSISLDAVPVEGNTIISLSWDGGEKLFEKTLSDQEASHQFDLISIDLAEVADLTKKGEYDSAKALMKKLGQKYAENTGDIVDTNLPKLHTTQASQDDHIWRQAKVSLTNVFPSGTKQEITFDTTEELSAYQGKQPGKADQDHIPLWDKTQKEKAPEAKDELAPPSLSYQDVEKKKERDTEDMQKHIDEKIKTELESALQEKAASVFGPDQVELVKVLRKNGRNWDEIKKILVKDFGFDKDSTIIFVDEQREGSDPTGIVVEPVKEEPETPLTPPEELVSPETHEKLLQDHEDKKKDNSPVEEIEKAEEPSIKEESAQKEVTCPLCFAGFSSKDLATQHMNDYHRMGQAKEINQLTESNFTPQDIMAISELDEIARADNDEIHKVAADDLNPLQEPIQERPTTPSQDVVPMSKPKDHNAPQHGDRVFVTTDLSREKAGFEATFIKDIKGNHGEDLSIVETDEGDILEVASNRVVKTSEGSGAQDTEPVMEPQIEMPKEQDIPVTPKMDDFHTSSQDDLLTLKIEAEALLKDMDNMGKTSYMFVRKGLEKHADDSAFEGNGWCRVWVQEDEVASDARYAEALKLPDENARIQALKEIARDLAHEALRLADSAGAKVGVQSWFNSLKPSDHDRIDWVALANPQQEEVESSLKQADSVMDTKCEDCGKPLGPEAFLSKWPVCGACTKKKHKKVTGSDFEKGISQNKTSDETLPATTPVKKNPSLKDKDIDPYKHHSDLEWETGDPCKLCKSPIDDNCQCTNAECEFHRCGQAFSATKPEGSEPDQVDLIMAYETGELDDAGILKLFSMLIKSGDAWKLQGSYGRTAKALIEAGYINEKGTITKDVVDTTLVPEQKMLSKQYAFKNEKTAAEPEVAPKTQFKDYKITPKYTPKEQAVPASPEMGEVLNKIESLQSNLDTLATARKQIEAKMKEELSKIDEQGERAQAEAALQESIEKAAVLIGALDNQVVQWKDKLYTLQTEQVDYVPKLTPKEMLSKIYAKFEGAEKYVQDVLNGMLSQAKSVMEKTLIRWPNKKSSVNKESSMLDDMNHYNEELLAALKELSTPL